MEKNIIEYRTLEDFDIGVRLSTNVDSDGKFYGLYIEVGEWTADNTDWIRTRLFPALMDWLYEEDGKALNALGEEVDKLSRKQRIALYEMISTALALGWFADETR